MNSKSDMDMSDRDKAVSFVDNIWNMIRQSPWHPIEVYPFVLYGLYGMHKNYRVEVCNYYEGRASNGTIRFIGGDDILLYDLYQNVMESVPQYDLPEFSKFSFGFVDHFNFGSKEAFDDIYTEVLFELNYRLATFSGRAVGEFLSPNEINKLIAYFVNKEDCQSVFDPFCGTASIVQYFSKEKGSLRFVGQDFNKYISLTARVILDAFPQINGKISCKDSILEWDNSHFDAVVSCPPFGYKLGMQYNPDLRDFNDSIEGALFSRAFRYNGAKLVVALLSTGFCDVMKHKRLRKYLIGQNYLDTLIFLPERLLFGTSIPCVLAVCKSHRESNAPIKIVDAQSYFTGDSTRTRLFDYDAFVRDFESDNEKKCALTWKHEVESYDYNLNLYLYKQRRVEAAELKEEQDLKTFGSVMREVQKERITTSDEHDVFSTKNFSADFIDVLLNQDKLVPAVQEKRSLGSRRLVRVKKGSKYLLAYAVRSSKPRYAIYTKDVDFTCSADVGVFEINESLVTPEYLVYLLTHNLALKTGKLPMTYVSMLPVAIESPDYQKEIVEKLKQEHAARLRAEQEADAQRLGVKTNISDLEHMLGTTYANMDDVLYRLGKISSEDDALKSLVKELKDNVEYLKRVIRYDNASITADDFNFKEQDIEAFIQSYCDSWKNYSGKYFELSLQINLGEHKMVVFDKALLKVMLDSILTNVERHGFDKRRNDTNQVEITLSLEKYEEKSFVVMRVANNGAPFKNGFTIKDYITRGRYSAKSGRSGLGGYHVYQITKGHQGFFYIDSNKIWNVIIEILLPINNVETDNLVEYEHECI